MIRAERLTKHFAGRPAVEGLDLDVREGEVFGFLGPNGAGKTTTVRMLACLIAPTSGRAWVNGHPVDSEQDAVRASVGILTESPGLYDRLSAERNLDFFARLYGMPEAHRQAQIKRYLQMLDLWDQRDKPVGSYSKGMRQKLALVRALLHEPPVLFLDEPTAALDPQAAKTVRDFIAELSREGRTVILCTHNLDEAERLCDRIAVLRTHLVALDTPDNLRRRLFGRRTVVRVRNPAPGLPAAVRDLPFVLAVEEEDGQLVVDLPDPEAQNPLLVKRLVELGAEVQYVGELQRSLEDVYLTLIEEEKTA